MSTRGWLHFSRRGVEALVTLAGLALFTFLLLKALPGGPFDEETPLHPLVREKLSQAWALKASAFEQFLAYVRSALAGEFGYSLVEPGRSVGSILSTGLSQTLLLNLSALVVILFLGVAVSLVAAENPEGPLDRFVDSMTIALISLPSLFLGPLLIWFFGMHLNWFPIAFLDGPMNYVLPVITLSLRPSAYLVRLLSRSLREAQSAEYMRTAKAKGLSERQALRHHALRNSLLPVLGALGPLIVGLLSGSFMVEVLFAIPGLGRSFVESLSLRDYPVVVGLTLFYGALLVAVSFLLDVGMKWADPRLKENS